jgi:hypothetical protein
VSDQQQKSTIRPLIKIRDGQWKSRDERWEFIRHESDPQPKRWFVFDTTDHDPEGDFPENEGSGVITLRDAIKWVERKLLQDSTPSSMI